MTPKELTRKRRSAEALVRRYAPASSHDELFASLRPAIVLNAARADDADIALGASKFGGAPDVPDGFVWPIWKGKSLTFLAQINLAEVAPFDLEKQLPSAGALLFFVMLDEQSSRGEEAEQRDSWRVLWAREPLQRVEPPADAHWIVTLNTQRVSFDAGWALDNMVLGDLGMNEDDWFDFQSEVLERAPHRMLTWPYAPQLSPLAYAANGALGKSGFDLYDESVETGDWELLLQLDTGAGEFFDDIHDVGWLYFIIRHDDLQNGDFSNVWLNQQST